ncbi:MAG: hypothetical protein QNJ44_13345 [Rhodobacter sp.]|nr:hypothetical protein [Rhodobacter sp.]
MTLDEIDASGLIREAYRIDGIGAAECRSIFVDWAIKLPAGIAPAAAIRRLLAEYGTDAEHPMTAVLQEGLTAPPSPVRRGGRRGRRCLPD